MKKLMLCLVALAALVATPALRAQSAAPPAPGDLSGNWQGTLKAGKDLRIIFNIYKGEKDGWSAKMYSIDQTPHPFPVTSVIRQGSAVTISVDLLGGSFEGKLDASGKSIAGTWTQGGQPLPLTLLRATPETAWDIPTPPAAEKPMAADADPSFDVATIKPNPSGGSSLQGLGPKGRHLMVVNGSLDDLITFAYSLQVKQVVNGPGWMDSDRYDIDALPDQPGTPNLEQARSMMKKLLADRFALKFHHDKRDLAAYVLTVWKTGQKLTPTQLKGNLPGFFYTPGTGGLTLHLINGTMKNFNRLSTDDSSGQAGGEPDRHYRQIRQQRYLHSRRFAVQRPCAKGPGVDCIGSAEPLRCHPAAAWPEADGAEDGGRCDRHRPRREAFAELTLPATPPFALS